MVTEAFYREMCDRLFVAEQFEKRASNDPTDKNLTDKTSHDVAIWERVKQAIDFGAVRSALGGAGKAVGKGMLYGAAPAAAAVGAGALAAPYVIDRAAKAKEQSTKNVIEDIRNKALQTALGVGAIGAGLTGMHHLLAGRREDAARQQAPQDAVNFSDSQGLLPGYGNDYSAYHKQGSVDEDALLEKLAAVGYLDVLLAETEGHTKVGEDASHCRLLNAEHGVHLLRQLMRS
jgi:hypothetical protein